MLAMNHQTKKDNISIARINNLEGFPIFDSSCGYYVLQITFSETTANIKTLSLFLGNSNEFEAEEMCSSIREKFIKANVFEGSKVVVYHNKRGIVKAIRAKNKPWFDVLNLRESTLFKIMN